MRKSTKTLLISFRSIKTENLHSISFFMRQIQSFLCIQSGGENIVVHFAIDLTSTSTSHYLFARAKCNVHVNCDWNKINSVSHLNTHLTNKVHIANEANERKENTENAFVNALETFGMEKNANGSNPRAYIRRVRFQHLLFFPQSFIDNVRRAMTTDRSLTISIFRRIHCPLLLDLVWCIFGWVSFTRWRLETNKIRK